MSDAYDARVENEVDRLVAAWETLSDRLAEAPIEVHPPAAIVEVMSVLHKEYIANPNELAKSDPESAALAWMIAMFRLGQFAERAHLKYENLTLCNCGRLSDEDISRLLG